MKSDQFGMDIEGSREGGVRDPDIEGSREGGGRDPGREE